MGRPPTPMERDMIEPKPDLPEEDLRADTRGAWVAYYSSNEGGVVIFAREIDCLRHALEFSKQAKFVEWGSEL